jgi:hypothetical protein
VGRGVRRRILRRKIRVLGRRSDVEWDDLSTFAWRNKRIYPRGSHGVAVFTWCFETVTRQKNGNGNNDKYD